jgi:RTX calcium-binding nonapeptide repeat (4 copies)
LCGMLGGDSSERHMPREGEGAVGRQGHLIAVVLAFLIGCAVVLMAGASGVQAEASKKEEARCDGTRTFKKWGEHFTTNDLPGCPKGGLLMGTDNPDNLAGLEGDDKIRGLGAKDEILGGAGNDVIYAGPGDDPLLLGDDGPAPGDDVIYGGPGDEGEILGGNGDDVIYGGDGNDFITEMGDRGHDKLYCGKGKDVYDTNKKDFVDSSCEPGRWVRIGGGFDTPTYSWAPSASASPVPIPSSGGAAILLPAAALLVGSGIVTYAILRRR